MSAHFARPDRHAALDRLTTGACCANWPMSTAIGLQVMQDRPLKLSDPATGAAIAWVSKLNADQTSIAVDAAVRSLAGLAGASPSRANGKIAEVVRTHIGCEG